MATSVRREAPVIPLEETEPSTLTRLYLGAIDRFGRHDAMLYEQRDKWHRLSHREVESRVERLAAGLSALGVSKGDRVAILSENRPEWAIADFAVLALGAADIPIYATLPSNQIAHILEDSGARIAFVSTREQLEKVEEVRDRLPDLEAVIAFDDPGVDGVVKIQEAMARGDRHIASGAFPGVRKLAAEVEPEDVATIIYTSGTTGHPKGVLLTHRNLTSNVCATAQHRVIELGPGMVALSFLPISHSFERLAGYYYWHVGATIAYVDAVDKLASALPAVRPHFAAAAPRVFEKIYSRVMGATGVRRAILTWAMKVGDATIEDVLAGHRSEPRGFREKLADRLVFATVRKRTGGRLKGFVSGSAPLAEEIARFFWIAGIPIYEGYGLTESSPVLTANKPGAVKLGTVGLPLPGTEVRIGPDGEVLARGPQIMKGYFRNPEATNEAIDADGWLHTGDIGEIDADGFLRITDRIKNIIVTAGGKNIAPAPLENAAAISRYVAQVVMIGDKRPFPSLLVVPDYDNLTVWARERGIADLDPVALARDPRVHELIEEETLGRLGGFARFEVPKKVAIVPTEFTIEAGEITPTLKIKRRVVEEHHRDLIEEIYAPG
ncbi:MAG: AMP-binding protein [Gemmatimonas sp.]|nr:AMP-binding protein [Gemmatimonas sp.]